MRLATGLLTFPLVAGCLIGDDPSETQANFINGTRDAFGIGDSSGVGRFGAFNDSLGTNGRTCNTCHLEDQGWTITPRGVQARFDATGGTDPIFRKNDGSNCDVNIDTSSTSARSAAYSMLRTKGLIRVSMPVPVGADFTLIAVDDPYHCASAAKVSLFRRPLPSTNLRFLSTLMWDGRESKFDVAGDLHTFNLPAGLGQQAIDATLGHAQATGTRSSDMASIVSFEDGIHTAQVFDNDAGDLDQNGANGGLFTLANVNFFYGINDPLGLNPTGAPFDPRAFTLYDAWKRSRSSAQQQIFRGQEIFNTKPIVITGVKGLNDSFGLPTINGTCTTCHDTPQVGNHSLSLAIDIGLTDASRRTSDMPLYTFRENSTGAVVKTTDPGRAMITGKFADIAKFKGAILRGLALRAPYFHNGSAATLSDAVDFYNTRFNIGLSFQEKRDLVAFLATL